MTLTTGSRLGPYEILSPLGAGGMGEVYRARDSRLGREVAIKVLPDRLAEDQTALSRFEREAQAIAVLSHPNILAIYDFGNSDGVAYAVMELLEGETLAERILEGPIPCRRAAEIGIAIAEGLSAAHAKGIIHRDLKPQNLFLTSDDRVKILDFGLARRDAIGVDDQLSAALTATGTLPGTVMGTVGYMSPEQVRGDTADARTDIFSLGCVLYEMVSSQRAFRRRTSADTLSAILHEEPAELVIDARDLAQGFRNLVARSLEKNPESRFQSARDVSFALKELLRGAGVAGPVSSGSHRRPIESMAVLPFANASGDPEAEYLSDGIAESIINSLSRLPNLRVIARSTLTRYRGKEVDPVTVGSELRVGAVLTGRVFHRGDSLVVKTELVDVRDGTQIWGENYNRKFSDVLALEEEIAREISEKLRLKLTGEDKQRLSERETENAEAYRLYLKGRFYWNKRSPDSLRKGIEFFQRAIEEDPEYAKAFAGIADCYNNLGFYNYVAPAESFPKAKAAARRALEIEADLAEAHASLGYALLYFDWNWQESEREFLRAIELAPNYPTAHQFYSNVLFWTGRLEEAMSEMRKALELDPLSLLISAVLGYGHYAEREYDKAIGQLRKTLEMDVSFVPAHLFLGYSLIQKGLYVEAIAEFEAAIRISGENLLALAWLGRAQACAGNADAAREVLRKLTEASSHKYVSPYCFALIHIGLGERDLAFADLETGFALRAHEMTFLRGEPQLDDLRSDPRFGDLVRRVGL